MAIDSRAKLRDLPPKRRPPRSFAKLVGDDDLVSMGIVLSSYTHIDKIASQTMSSCPVYGEQWVRIQVKHRSAQNKQNCASQKEREREKKEVDVKAAVLKNQRAPKDVSCIHVALGIPLTSPGRCHNSVHPVAAHPSSNQTPLPTL